MSYSCFGKVLSLLFAVPAGDSFSCSTASAEKQFFFCHKICQRIVGDQSRHSSDLRLNVSDVMEVYSFFPNCSVTTLCMTCSHLLGYNRAKAAEPLSAPSECSDMDSSTETQCVIFLIV